MKRSFVFIICILFLSLDLTGQVDDIDPYKISPFVDIPILAVSGATGLIGYNRLNNKTGLDSAQIAALNPNDINKLDRHATHTHHHAQLNTYSNIALYSSFATPFLLFLNQKSRNHIGKIGLLYLETMAIAGNAYVWIVGSTDRIRPYVYDSNISMGDKLNNKTKNSFIAGHPFAAASATFFAAKAFHDHNPGSKYRKYVWAAAIIPPAFVTYFRYRNGEHFPTDIMAGIPMGVLLGILIPQLHKSKSNANVHLFPAPGGLGMIYKFK